MSNEVIDVKQLPKETVAKFVNDAAEMETSSFTLKQMASNIKNQNHHILNQDKEDTKRILNSVKEAEEELNKQKNFEKNYTYQQHKDYLKNVCNKRYSGLGVPIFIVLFGVFGVILFPDMNANLSKDIAIIKVFLV